MRPLTEQCRHRANEGDGLTVPNLGPVQYRPQESRVVVLGVMYPTAFTQPFKVTPDLPPLTPGAATGRQSPEVLFHDPISAWGSNELPQKRLSGASETATQGPRRRDSSKRGQVTRAEAIEAVVRELAWLQARNHGYEGWAGAAKGHNGGD